MAVIESGFLHGGTPKTILREVRFGRFHPAFTRAANATTAATAVSKSALSPYTMSRWKVGITAGKARIGHQAGHSSQGFGDRVGAVSGELMTVRHGIRHHNLSGQECHFGKIIMRADHV